MSYRLLTREEMVSISATLVDETHEDCQVLKSHPLSRVLWKLVADAHARLLSVQRIGPTPERLIELSKRLGGLDGRHDDVLRGLYYGLLAQEYLAEDPDLAAEVRKLRIKMFPEDLMATRKSYRGQVGQAMMLESRLTEEDLELLRRLSTAQGGTFVTAVEEWFRLAEEMGKLDNERMGDSEAPSAAEVLAARNNWIRAIHAFVAPLRMESDVPGAVIAILDRIDAMVDRANQRRGHGRDAEESDNSGSDDIESAAAEDAPAGDAAGDADASIPGTGPVEAAVLDNHPPETTPEEQPAG